MKINADIINCMNKYFVVSENMLFKLLDPYKLSEENCKPILNEYCGRKL